MSQFINIGIDLGTTTTEACVFENKEIRVVKSSTNMDYIPSAVLVKKNGTMVVGQKAYDNHDVENLALKFKRQAGTEFTKHFSASKKTMTVEQLQAEVLKEMKGLIQNTLGKNVSTAVVTVPAQFTSSQKSSVLESAKLAGFSYVELLQEPVAAAIAFANSTNPKPGKWLIYDLGGGTFDVAVLEFKAEEMKVLSTDGHAQLGGSDIDKNIVNQVIIPALQNSNYELEAKLNDHTFRLILSKFAEDAKKELTLKDSTIISIEQLEDDNGDEIELNIKFDRNQLKNAVASLIEQTFEYCQKALKNSNTEIADLDQICLVGGPTQIPIVREILREYFGDILNISADPTTAVARGACIFAQSKLIPETNQVEVNLPKNVFKLKLDYTSVCNLDEQFVMGEFDSDIPKTVEIVLENAWSSGKISVKNKKFALDIVMQKDYGEEEVVEEKLGERFDYKVLIFDDKGNQLEPSLSEFSVFKQFVIDDFTVAQTIGYEANNGKFVPMIEKGSKYPILISKKLKYENNSGKNVLLKIWEINEMATIAKNIKASFGVLQQEHSIAISKIKVNLKKLPELELIFEIDKSGILTAILKVVANQQEFKFEIQKQKVDEKMEDQNEEISKKLEKELANLLEDTDYLESRPQLKAMQNKLENLSNDDEPDTISKNNHELREIQSELEILKNRVKGENHEEISRANEKMQEQIDIVVGMGESADRLMKNKNNLLKDGSNSEEILENSSKIIADIIHNSFKINSEWFLINVSRRVFCSDQNKADFLINIGYEAFEARDTKKLLAVNAEFVRLLPKEKQGAGSLGTGLSN